MTGTITKSDHEIHQAVITDLEWNTQVDETEVGVEVDSGAITLTGTVSSFAKKMAAQEAAHHVAGVLDVANDILVKVPGTLARTDTDIALAVRRGLEWDALVPDEKIRSTIINGWVTLEGTVPCWADRCSAESAVRNLNGVHGVTNGLTVNTPTVASETVRRSIQDALERRADREAERIEVDVTDGTVILTGRVNNWAEKQAVLGAAGYAPGVRKVEDHLRVNLFF